jgi:cytoskeletal protein CcmA (bactofilin family)
MFGKKTTTQKTIDSLIGAGTRIEGNIIFEGGLRIDGVVQGNVVASAESPTMLVISEQARVEGEVRAAHLVVNGTIVGPIYATELIELQPKAKVTGDVHYQALEMHHGAIVQGTLMHEDETAKPGLKLASSNS